MQHTYEEAVRELSDFLGQYATAQNVHKLQQAWKTILAGTEEADGEYENGRLDGYSDGYAEGVRTLEGEVETSYKVGYEEGLSEGKSDLGQAFQSGYEQGYTTALRDNGECY